MFYRNINDDNRQAWLKSVLLGVHSGARILDAGAGELRNRQYCSHLDYVSQDFCQYDSKGSVDGLHSSKWDTGGVDIVSDITQIPESDGSFDVILCTEVLEHVPDPIRVISEFSRLLKAEGMLILTAPFASLVHMAPYYYCSGFSRYWYEEHLNAHGFEIIKLESNGDWFSFCEQELMRLGGMSRQYGNPFWSLGYFLSWIGRLYFKLSKHKCSDDLACFGWHCVAKKI